MKKRLLTLAALVVAFVGSSFAYNIGDYAYTSTQRVKILGENIVQNGDFTLGTEGWTNAAGEGTSADVWSMEEAAGPNGENAIMSLNGSTDDAALCRAWTLSGGTYLITYDIKGEGTNGTGIVSGASSCVDIFLTTSGTLTKADGDVNVSTVDGYKDVWKTNAYAFVAEEGQSLVMHVEKLATNTQLTNVKIYPAKVVYDDRILQQKLAYVDRLIATGKFVQDTENEFIGNIVEVMRSMLGTTELDDASNAEVLVAEYENELLSWLDVNAADLLKEEKKWSAYGDTRKQNAFGNWKGGYRGRWFHKNNGGSNEITNDGDEIGYRFQGGNALQSERIAYSLVPNKAGTYMFSLDVVGHYMAGTSGKVYNFLPGTTDNYVTDWNRDFKGVTVYAGKEEMVADDTDAERNVEQEGQKVDCGVISNPNAKLNCQRFVVFYEVSQAQVDAGEPLYFGIAYVPDAEVTAKLGCNVNIANPQIRLIGVTQDEIDFENEVAKIIVQQTALNERLGWAKDDVVKTAQDGYPWGKADLQAVIDQCQPAYDASLEVVDAEGNVKNADLINEFLDYVKNGTGTAYSDSLLRVVQAVNSGRSAYSNINKPIANYRQEIADAEAVRDDVMNAQGDKKTFQAAIDAAIAKLDEVLAVTTDETREADEEMLTAQLALLAEAVEAFKQSAALTPIVDIDFSNGFEPWVDAEGITLGLLIKGAAGQMTFPDGVANAESNVVLTNESKGIGEMSFALGVGEELLDVLRVGNGSATVEIAEADRAGDDEVIRFNFNAWLLRLTDGYFTIDLLNAADQRVAGFSYCSYSEAVAYNDFNNEANEGMILNKSTAVANTTGDAGSHTDSNKSGFSLIVDYKAKAVQGIIEGPNGFTTGQLIPLRTQVDEETPLEDNKVAKFVLTSNYKNYPGRRCWFDDLQVFKYASQADGPIVDGISTIASEPVVKGIYTLSGQKVEKAVKGLYIVNGKKVLVK
ncbi:MAG: hypothetical protein K5683_01060 [Prevotella sp.]|nr:hypothetical protein [Prevotella sp.]